MALPIAVVTFLILGSMIGVFGYRRYVLAGRLYENIDPGPTLQSPSPDAGSQSSGAMGCMPRFSGLRRPWRANFRRPPGPLPPCNSNCSRPATGSRTP